MNELLDARDCGNPHCAVVGTDNAPEVRLPMESGSKCLHQKVAAMFTWLDALILLAVAALGVVFVATVGVTPRGQFFVFWVLLVCAAVLIGVKHVLASMRCPLVAFASCLLGGILGGAPFWFLASSFVKRSPGAVTWRGLWGDGGRPLVHRSHVAVSDSRVPHRVSRGACNLRASNQRTPGRSTQENSRTWREGLRVRCVNRASGRPPFPGRNRVAGKKQGRD